MHDSSRAPLFPPKASTKSKLFFALALYQIVDAIFASGTTHSNGS